ncbi:MAG: hypothetical protein JO122_15620 [Acetobacteraceae bacterium]|nr:hypothetical protein [Acetobacteraceae bacterium]
MTGVAKLTWLEPGWELSEADRAHPKARAANAAVKSSAQAQRFLSAPGMIYGHFRPRRRLMAADVYARAKAFWIWKQETCARVAA